MSFSLFRYWSRSFDMVLHSLQSSENSSNLRAILLRSFVSSFLRVWPLWSFSIILIDSLILSSADIYLPLFSLIIVQIYLNLNPALFLHDKAINQKTN